MTRESISGKATKNRPKGCQSSIESTARRTYVEGVQDCSGVGPVSAGSQARKREKAMTIDGAIIKEHGVTFGLVVVRSHALESSTTRDDLILQASQAFGGIPTILMAQSGGQTRYYGRPDLVRFMRTVPLANIPWKRYRLSVS